MVLRVTGMKTMITLTGTRKIMRMVVMMKTDGNDWM